MNSSRSHEAAVVKAIHIPDDLLCRLKARAALNGRTLREVAAVAIRNYLGDKECVNSPNVRRSSKTA